MPANFIYGPGMKFFLSSPAFALISLLLSACSGIMPGIGILAPDSPAGWTMDFSDLLGTHRYKLLPDHTYRSETVVRNAPNQRRSTGSWKWDRLSPDSARLTLDGEREISLRFTTADHANGSFAADPRLYAFEFTPSR